MPSDLTGRAVYVVSSGLQMDPQLHGEVQENPVKLFSDIKNARIYARNLAKELFWDNMKDGYPYDDEDGYRTPTGDDHSRDGHFDDDGDDYISFSAKSYDRRNDEESDTGYVSVDLMYIDEEVEEKTTDTNDNNNKKRKTEDSNESPANDPAPVIPTTHSQTPSASWTVPATSLPTAAMSLPTASSLLPSTTPMQQMPFTPCFNSRPMYATQPDHFTSRNQQFDFNAPSSNSIPYWQNSFNAHGHPVPLASYTQPTSNSPTIPNDDPNPLDQPYTQHMAYDSTVPGGAAVTMHFNHYMPPEPSMAHSLPKYRKQ
ncbi:hypothetical protein MBANPS3_003666 [Mucor bainieri]